MAKFEDILTPFTVDTNFSSILIGADAPVLEVELNELQLIQRERLRLTTKAMLNEGVKGRGTYAYNTSTKILNITDELVMIDGELVDVPNATLVVNEGDIVYVEVWEKEITFADKIPVNGHVQASDFIPNYLLDPRIGEETSRRIQVQYQVTTTPNSQNKSLEIGYVEHGHFILLANNLNAKITPHGNGLDFTVYRHFTLMSPLGKKFKLKATYDGELYTEPSTDAELGLPLIVTDPSDNSWMITVDEQGRLTTLRVAKNPLNVHHYLETPPPFGIIFKIEITEQGELKLASVCEVDIINDGVTTLDKTWSSYKLNQHVLAQDKVVEDLAKDQTEFLQQVIAEKDKLISDLTNEKNKLISDLTTEKDKIIADLRAENERLIAYTEAKINEMVSWYTTLNSPNGTLFEIKVDDEGVLETLEKEVILHG